MPLVSVDRLPGGGADKGSNGRVYSAIWQVEFDGTDPNEGGLEARLEVEAEMGGIGAIYTDYDGNPLDTFTRARTITPQLRRGHRFVWDVVVQYEAKHQYTQSNYDDPLQRPAEISFEGALFTKALEKDLDGKPIVTSAGTKFDPPLESNISRARVVVVQNEAYNAQLDPGLMAGKVRTHNNSINSDEFLGAAIGFLRVRLAAQRHFENGAFYWSVTYEIEEHEGDADNLGWLSEGVLLDASTVEITDDGQGGYVFHDIIDDGGNIITDPWPLNGNGTKLTASEVKQEQWSYLQFRTYKWSTFADMNIQI